MKTLIAFLAGALLAGLLPFAHSAGAQDFPPDGVAAANWVPVGKSLGLVIVENPAGLGIVVPPAQRRAALAGRFMVKHNGKWQSVVVLGPASGLTDPL